MKNINRLSTVLCLIVSLSIAMSGLLHAANETWNGVSGNWGLAGNWSPNAVPGATDTAIFNSGGGSVNLPAAESIGNITFDTNARSYAITGNIVSGGTINGTAYTLTLGNSGTLQIASTLSGAGRQENIYAPLTLGSNYTIANNSTVQGNDLAILGNVSLGANTLTLSGTNAASQYFTSSNNNVIAGVISGTGGLTKNGSGTWFLNGTNTFSGATTVSAGVLTYGGTGGFANASAITVAAGASVSLVGSVATSATSTQSLTISGGGAGGVLPYDTNYLYIGNYAAFESFATNTYSGAITLGADSSIASAGGTLTFTPGSGSTGSINTGGFQIALLTDGNFHYSGSMVVDDVISGSGGIIRNGSIGTTANTANGGTVTLGAANTYTGSTVLDADNLTLDFSQSTAPATQIIKNSATNTLVLQGGTLNLLGKASTTNSQSFSAGGTTIGSGATKVTITNNATANTVLLNLGAITRNVGGTVDFTQPTVGSVSSTNGYTTTATNTSGILGGYATVAGADWATVSGGNIIALPSGSYTNDTWASGNNTTVTLATNTAYNNVTTNSLRFSNTAAGDTVSLTGTNVITSGGILVSSASTQAQAISGGTLEGSSGGDLVIIDNNTTSALTISSAIANNGSATGLTKSGTGTLVLSSGTSSYTGVTTLNAGTLDIASASALGASTSFVINGGTFNNTSGGALTLTNGNSMTEVWNEDITFAGTNSLNLGTGAVSLGSTPASQRQIVVDGSTLTVGGVISNGSTALAPTGLTKTDGGTLLLTGLNTYTGPTGVSGGVLSVTNLANGGLASGLGASSNAASNLIFDASAFKNGDTLQYSGSTAASTDRLFTITSGGGALDASGTGSGTVDFTNTGVIVNSSFQGSTSKIFTLTGTNTGNNIFTPVFTDYNSGSLLYLVKSGAGTWSLAGANTFSGETTITAGTLGLSNVNALQDSTLVNTGGSVMFTVGGSGNTYTLGGLIGPSNLSLVDTGSGSNAITLQIGNNNYTTSSTNNLASGSTYVGSVYSGVLSDGGLGSSIVKVGTGSWTPSGANTYSGTTTVSAGTLVAGAAVAPSTAGPFGNSASAIVLGDAATTTNNSSVSLLDGGFNISRPITVSNNATKGGYAIGGNTSGSSTYSGLLTLDQNLTISQVATTGSTALNVTGGITSGGGSEIVNFAGPGSINVNTTAISNGSGTLGVDVTGGTTTFTTQDTYTGTTAIGGGTLLLDFSQGASPTSNIVSSSSALVLGGGTLSLNSASGATNSQTFNGVTVNPGASTVSTSENGTNGTLNLALGAITRNVGGTVNFVGPMTTTTTNTNGILGGYATVAGTDWAANDGSGNIIALPSASYYTTTTGGTTAANYAGKNVDVTSSPTFVGAITPNTLRFNTAAAETVTLATGTANKVAAGGILETSNVGANAITIAGANATTSLLEGSSGGDLIIQQNNTAGTLTISAVIADNTSATALTKSGAGTLILSGANTYTGNTYLNGGTTVISNVAAFGGGTTGVPGGTVYISNGAELAASGTIQPFNAINLNGNVTLGDSTNNGTLGLFGAITLSGNTVLTVNNTTVIKNAIGDGGNGYGLTKNGAGTLDYGSGSSPGYSTATYSGATTVNAGTLAVNIGATNYVNPINPASTLVLGGGTFSLTFSSSALVQSQTFNGLTLNAGASAVATVNSSGAGALNLGQITRNVGSTVDVTYNGNITSPTKYGTGVIGYMTIGGTFAAQGNGGVLGQASATAAVTGSNSAATFSGNFISLVQGSTVGSGAVINPSALQFNQTSASLAVNSSTLPSENVIGSGGILVTSSATGATGISSASGTAYLTSGNGTDLIVIDNASSSGGSNAFTISPVITDNGSTSIALTKSGVGTLILNGANTYTGATYLNGGTIQAGTTTALGSASTANLIFDNNTASSGATFNLNGNNTTLTGLSTNAAIVGGATVEASAGNGTATLTVNNTANSTYAGTLIDGGGTLNFAKSGSGTLVLSGVNTYSGTTTVSGGTLTLNGGGSLAATTMSVTGNGTTVKIGGNYTIGTTLGLNAALPVTFGSGTVLSLVDGSINTLTFGANISQLTLSSTTLDFEVGSTADQINLVSGTYFGSGNTINLTELGTLSGTQQILIQNIGSAGLAGNFTLGTTSLDGYTLSLADVLNGSTYNLVLNETLNVAPTSAYFNGIGNDLNNSANYYAAGTGTTAITSAPVSTTNVYFSNAANSSISPNITAPLTVNSVTFGAGGGTNSGITVSSSNTADTLTIAATSANGNTAGNGITIAHLGGSDAISAPVVLGASQTWTATDANSTLTVSGQVSDGGNVYTLTKAGAGSLILSNPTGNIYTGGTTISAGTLYANSASGSSTGTGSVSVTAGGTLAGGGMIKPTGGAGVTVSSGAKLASGSDQTLNAIVNGGSGAVNGTGTGGGLTLDNTEASSTLVNISGGATLSFALGSTGAYNSGSGALNFAAPNTDSTFLNITGSTVDQIFSNTSTADIIKLVDLTYGVPQGGIALTLRSSNPYLLIQTALGNNNDFQNLMTTGGLGQNGFITGVSNGSGGYTAFSLGAYDINGNPIGSPTNLEGLQLYLYNGDIEVVPEPGTWALMIGGLALLIVVQRRRKNQG